MTLQQAIEKAIEGGWLYHDDPFIRNPVSIEVIEGGIELKGKPRGDGWDGGTSMIRFSQLNMHKILLDPEFWRALGKSMGWVGEIREQEDHWNEARQEWEKINVVNGCTGLSQWHRFIDHLAENKSIESYFETL